MKSAFEFILLVLMVEAAVMFALLLFVLVRDTVREHSWRKP